LLLKILPWPWHFPAAEMGEPRAMELVYVKGGRAGSTAWLLCSALLVPTNLGGTSRKPQDLGLSLITTPVDMEALKLRKVK
jgi:hypothetical protein